MDADVKKEYNRLSQLLPYKEKSEEFLEKQATRNIFLRRLVSEGNFQTDDEKKIAKSLFNKYLEKSDFDEIGDLNTLGTLVYNEILLDRIQKNINSFRTVDDETFIINDKTVKVLHETEKRILELKRLLGLCKEDKKIGDLSQLQTLKEIFYRHIALNKNEFSCTCANCGKLLLLRKKTKDFTTLVHPFFSGRWYYNKRGMQLVKDGVWTKKQYAYVFRTSVDYVDWCIKK